MKFNIEQFRKDTPYCDDLIHPNNAGASLSPRIVNDAIINYLRDEARIGGYEIVEDRKNEIKDTYIQAAKLINALPEEIALTDCDNAISSRILFTSSSP